MTKTEGSRPDHNRREGRESLAFQALPALRPSAPAGYRAGFWRGFATGLALAMLSLFLGLAMIGQFR